MHRPVNAIPVECKAVVPGRVQYDIVWLTPVGSPVAVVADRFGISRASVYRLRRNWIKLRYQKRP